MPMINLGHTSGGDMPEEATSSPDKERIDYPTIYVRERDGMKLPELPKGEFYAVIKGRVAGYRDPADGEKSVDLEVMSMSAAVDGDEAKALVKSSYEEMEDEDDGKFSEKAAVESFRSSLKESQIGQSG